MPFRDAFPILHTGDAERLATFYCDAFGFVPGYRFPENGRAAFIVVTLGELSLGLTQTENRDELGRVDLWLYTDDVDAEVARLGESGARVVDPPADRAWGERMATVADPDGNIVHIGSR
jgi:lactoylglutathione lyase